MREVTQCITVQRWQRWRWQRRTRRLIPQHIPVERRRLMTVDDERRASIVHHVEVGDMFVAVVVGSIRRHVRTVVGITGWRWSRSGDHRCSCKCAWSPRRSSAASILWQSWTWIASIHGLDWISGAFKGGGGGGGRLLLAQFFSQKPPFSV